MTVFNTALHFIYKVMYKVLMFYIIMIEAGTHISNGTHCFHAQTNYWLHTSLLQTHLGWRSDTTIKRCDKDEVT